MAKRKNEIEISLKDVSYIYGFSIHNFNSALKNVFCVVCKAPHTTEITDFKILLNDLNDLELEGHCKECGSKVGRYIETGGVEQYTSRIEAIRTMRKLEK